MNTRAPLAAGSIPKAPPPDIAEGVLNHLPPKLVRTYDKNKYEKEKREALDLWAAHLTALASGGRR